VPQGKDFKAVVDVPEDDTVLAHAQTVASVPFAVQRLHIARARRAVPRDRFKNSQRGSSINCAKLRLRFRRKWKTQWLSLAEQLFDHLVVVVTDDCLSRVRLCDPSPD
jgi:hypothetical protein